MNDHTCLVRGCTFRIYAPAGTASLCKEHFLNFVTWRRRKGPQMFHKYGAMPTSERDIIVAEWMKSLVADDK
jgi:hypothetical protein